MYVCLYVCLSVCMDVCILALPLCSPVFPAKTRGFQCFRKEDVQKHRVFQIFGKRMQEAHTPNGAKECPINPDHISRERTTEIIDASTGGDPDILEDNWRLTSQANKPMINLWIGKTIFTFSDNSLKDVEAGSGSAADRSSTRGASRLLSQILSHHSQKNQHRFRLP